MKILTAISLVLLFSTTCIAQNPGGKWKKLSHVSSFDGQTFDSHQALLQQRPCADKIVYEFNSDGTHRLNASQSGCDERYRKIQETLLSQSTWKLTGNSLFIGGKEGIGQTYTVKFLGDKMILTGNQNEGTITYQKL
jgi:hypothetical protein